MRSKIFKIIVASLIFVVAGNIKSAHSFELLTSANLPRTGDSLTFFLNPNMPSGSTAEQEEVLEFATEVWNTDGRSNFVFNYAGTTTETDFFDGSAGSDDGVQIIIADACGENADGDCNCEPGTLAYTYGGSDDPDIIICSDFDYYVSVDEAVSSTEHDLISLLLHELGHTLGLDHSDYAQSVMVSGLSPGDIERTLWDETGSTSRDAFNGGDVQGAQYLYGEVDADGDGYKRSDGDCDDSDSAANPAASEVCFDSTDNNCDGDIDEGCDSDGDGLTDDEETTYGTDPSDTDSDDDGLSDGEEISTHGTDPNDSDSDDDNLSDGDEVSTHGTDPNDSDSDDDGLTDDLEIEYGFDPNDSGDGMASVQVIIGFLLSDTDEDGDGYYVDRDDDCNDSDASIYPSATEICGDGIDQDCDGSDSTCPATDDDGDSYTEDDGDCDDGDSSIHPDRRDCGTRVMFMFRGRRITRNVADGIDQDCDGSSDEDSCSFTIGPWSFSGKP